MSPSPTAPGVESSVGWDVLRAEIRCWQGYRTCTSRCSSPSVVSSLPSALDPPRPPSTQFNPWSISSSSRWRLSFPLASSSSCSCVASPAAASVARERKRQHKRSCTGSPGLLRAGEKRADGISRSKTQKAAIPSPSANDTQRTGAEGEGGKGKLRKPVVARQDSDALTHVDVLHQLLVGRLVLLQDVVVDAAAGERRAEQEAEEAVANICQREATSGEGRSSYPPRNAPTGLRAGNAGAAIASKTRAELWKLRDERAAKDALGSVRRPDVRIRDAIVSKFVGRKTAGTCEWGSCEVWRTNVFLS